MTDARQLSIVGMIDICGNNLLDTMNHLLDYAKINNLTRVGKRRKRPPKGDQDHVESVSLVDLNQLVHDVVEGTHRGQTATLGSRDDTSSARGSSGAKAGDVLVTLDIEARDWCMEISVGAWKRILMNIFSNALKYTDNGLVEVKLQMAESSDNGQKMISLSVKDTGRGIGDAYLKHHLFEPFTQEDNLSSGTGLGLSIVQQIVRNLEGRINVQSEKGVGTRIEVLLPAPNSSQCGPIAEVPQVADHLHGSVPSVESYRGRTICLVGFDVLPDLSEPPSGILSAEVQRLIYCKAWITQVAREWLGMEIVAAAALQSMGADVYIAESSSVSSTFDDPHGRPLTLKLGLRPNPEFNADFVPGSDFDPKAVIVNQPLTPRKLALALLECFQLHSNPSAIDGDSNNTDLPLRAQESSILSLVKDLHITDSMESVVTSRVSERHPQVLVQNAVSLQSADGKVDAVSIMSFPSTIAEHHVLLVDDNIINLRILTTYIQKLGCSYAAASDGLEALNVFKSTSRPFSYVFMDISMPIMDGLESTRHIREFERERALSGPKACIVALTGLGSSASQKEAANSGMDMFLTKPVQLKNIKKLLGGDHSMLAG
jgi:CheY-like chemotaxis protein/anti-sigma regulatory factor (Ser/Thr protein kinase)